jgi:hypothetical protein
MVPLAGSCLFRIYLTGLGLWLSPSLFALLPIAR